MVSGPKAISAPQDQHHRIRAAPVGGVTTSVADAVRLVVPAPPDMETYRGYPATDNPDMSPYRGGALGLARVRKRRSLRLLETTNTELNAIAAPASIGLSNPAAASGRAATL